MHCSKLALSVRRAASSRRRVIQKFAGEVKPKSFIVKLKPGTDKAAHLAALQPHLGYSQVTHDYDPEFLNAFGGSFTENTLNFLRASPDVECIEEDGIFHTMATVK